MQNYILVIGAISLQNGHIQSKLTRYGLVVETACTGGSGLLVAHRRVPGAIVLDMDLPDDDTFRLVRALKSDPATAHIPVIFLTHREETNAVLNFFQAGAFDYIRKDAFTEHNLVESLRCLNLL
jgi:CheY-like chemotaxis protein